GAELLTEDPVTGVAAGEGAAQRVLGLAVRQGDRALVSLAVDGERGAEVAQRRRRRGSGHLPRRLQQLCHAEVGGGRRCAHGVFSATTTRTPCSSRKRAMSSGGAASVTRVS